MPISLSDLKVKVQIPQHGEFVLGWLTSESIRIALESDTNLSARDFCVRFLHHLLEAPVLTAEEVEALPDRVLVRLLRTWSASSMGLDHPLPSKAATFPAFRSALRNYFSTQSQRLHDATKALISSFSSSLSSLTPSFAALNLGLSALETGNLMPRMVMPDGESYSALIPTFTTSLFGISELRVQEARDALAGSLSAITKAIDLSPLFDDLHSQLTALNVSSLLVNRANVGLSAIIHSTDLASSDVGLTDLLKTTLEASEAFGRFYPSIIKSVASLPEFSPSSVRNLVVPPMTTATLLDTVQQVTDQDRVEAVYRAKTDEFPYHTDLEVEVEIYLRRIDPEFVNQWKGSWQALYSNNPDRYRQAAHSGRELLNHIMHTLAPDACFSPEEVREKGQKGRPTRKMRIARILGSSIGKKPGSTEIAFVDATVQFVDTLYDSLTARAHDHSGVFRFVELKGYLTVLNGVIVHLLAER